MKQNVIKFLQNLPKEKYEQFNEAFELYRKSPGKNPSVERSVNAAGFSERSLENLLYDLQKMHGITDVEKMAVAKPLVVKDDGLSEGFKNFLSTIKVVIDIESNEELIDWASKRQEEFKDVDYLLGFAIDDENEKAIEVLTKAWISLNIPTTENENVKKLVENLDTEVPAVSIELEEENKALVSENENLASENEDLQFEKEELEEENEGLKDELETLKSLPKIDAKSIRVEFPFLNDKDCPDEFKILIADKITAWNEYLNCQVKLHEVEEGTLVLSEKELADLAALTIENFRENQKIYDELVAYAESGKVLGVHPIFKKLQLSREVEEMTADELVKYKGSSAKYFTDNRQSLAKAEKAKNTEKIELINNRVAERELKLALVNKKLGINPK